MTSSGQRRKQLCVTATTTALLAGWAFYQADASQTHTLKYGETVESVARKYNINLRSLLTANNLKQNDIIFAGRSLFIPDSHKPTVLSPTMERVAKINAERVNIRVGPGTSHESIDNFSTGVRIVVTAESNGWLQIQMRDGRIGWIRQDFVAFGSTATPSRASLAKTTKTSPAPASTFTAKTSVRRNTEVKVALAKTRESRKVAKSSETANKKVAVQWQKPRREDVERSYRRHSTPAVQLANNKRQQKLQAEATEARRKYEAERRQQSAVVAARRKKVEEQSRQNAARLAAIKREQQSEQAQLNAQRRAQQAAILRQKQSEQARLNAERRASEAEARRQKQAEQARLNAERREAQAIARRQKAEAQAKAVTKKKPTAKQLEIVRNLSHRYRPEASLTSASKDIVRSAYAYRGTPYRWGASSPGAFDCSGFTKYIYSKKGVQLPRTAAQQYHAGKSVGYTNLKEGDLVFFTTTRPGISHVGMYVGNGKFIHSSSRRAGGVRVDSLSSGYFRNRFRGGRRVQKDAPVKSQPNPTSTPDTPVEGEGSGE